MFTSKVVYDTSAYISVLLFLLKYTFSALNYIGVHIFFSFFGSIYLLCPITKSIIIIFPPLHMHTDSISCEVTRNANHNDDNHGCSDVARACVDKRPVASCIEPVIQLRVHAFRWLLSPLFCLENGPQPTLQNSELNYIPFIFCDKEWIHRRLSKHCAMS